MKVHRSSYGQQRKHQELQPITPQLWVNSEDQKMPSPTANILAEEYPLTKGRRIPPLPKGEEYPLIKGWKKLSFESITLCDKHQANTLRNAWSTVLNSDNAACCELEPGWCLENWPQAKAACHLTSSDKIWDKGTKVQRYKSSKVEKLERSKKGSTMKLKNNKQRCFEEWKTHIGTAPHIYAVPNGRLF